MDKLISILKSNPFIKRNWVEFRELTIADFDVVETHVPTWEEACWEGRCSLNECQSQSDVMRILKLKPELIAELQVLEEISPDMFTEITRQFHTDYNNKESAWQIFLRASIQLDYQGCKKEDMARKKFESAIATGLKKIDEFSASTLAALNINFKNIARHERRLFEGNAIRFYTNPLNWDTVTDNDVIKAEEEAIEAIKKHLDERRAALRAMKCQVTLSSFEKYLEDEEWGSDSLVDEVRDAIRQRLAEYQKQDIHFLRRR